MTQYEGRPFALIGVNSDRDIERSKQAVEKNKLNWRSFWAGPQGTRGEIPASWNVRGWPTMVLIDHQGTIVWRAHFLDAKAKATLEELVKQAEAQ